MATERALKLKDDAHKQETLNKLNSIQGLLEVLVSRMDSVENLLLELAAAYPVKGKEEKYATARKVSKQIR